MPHAQPPFSRRKYIVQQLLIQAGIQLSVRLIWPDYWIQQWTAGWSTSIRTFLWWHAGVALFEYSLHRWNLHKVFLGFLKELYRAHKHHHDITDIIYDRERGRVVSHYAIETEEQNEASSFPWWVAIVVSGIFAAAIGVLAIVSWGIFTALALIPAIAGSNIFTSLRALALFQLQNIPLFSMGSLAIMFSNMGYELAHAEFHRPYEQWEQRVERSRFRVIWKWIYGGHLLHHANRLCNLWVFGFFGLPLWDWIFGTLVIPKKLLLHDRTATAEDFPHPRPRKFILAIDRWVAARQRKIIPPPKRTAA